MDSLYYILKIVNASAGYLRSYEKSVLFFSLKYEAWVRDHTPNRPRCVTYISAFVYFLRQFRLVWTEIWCVLVGSGLDYLVVCLLCCLLPGFKTSLVDLFVSSSDLECARSGHSVGLKCSCTCKPRRAPLTSDLSLTSHLRDLGIGYHLVVL